MLHVKSGYCVVPPRDVNSSERSLWEMRTKRVTCRWEKAGYSTEIEGIALLERGPSLSLSRMENWLRKVLAKNREVDSYGNRFPQRSDLGLSAEIVEGREMVEL
ncbi:hypothetical protein TNCV_1070171 [Trichonephila clavipes]|nr:hypothetical protein TNCV_1070171 [Trichonephila clavipes]